MRSEPYQKLSPGARSLYMALWGYALEKKREIIKRPDDYYLATIAALHRHPITTYLRRMHDSQIIILSTTHIAMVGLRKKHSKIKFRDEFENSGIIWKKVEGSSSLSYPSLSEDSSLRSESSAKHVLPQEEKEKVSAPPTKMIKEEKEHSEKDDILEKLKITARLSKPLKRKSTTQDEDYWNSPKAHEWANSVRACYSRIDHALEIQRADAWCISNPEREPKSDFMRFLNGWFGRADERARKDPGLFQVKASISGLHEFTELLIEHWQALYLMIRHGIKQEEAGVKKLLGEKWWEAACWFHEHNGLDRCDEETKPLFFKKAIEEVMRGFEWKR